MPLRPALVTAAILSKPDFHTSMTVSGLTCTRWMGRRGGGWDAREAGWDMRGVEWEGVEWEEGWDMRGAGWEDGLGHEGGGVGGWVWT